MMMNDLDVTVIKLADNEFLLGEFSKIEGESKYESSVNVSHQTKFVDQICRMRSEFGGL